MRKTILLTMTRFFSFSLRTPIANSITLLAYCGKLTKYDSLRRIGVEFYIKKKKQTIINKPTVYLIEFILFYLNASQHGADVS